MKPTLPPTELIHVALSTDRNYLQHAGVMIASILCNAAESDQLKIHVIHADLTDDDMALLQSLKPLSKGHVQIVSQPIDAAAFDIFPSLPRVSIATYYRLMLHELFHNLSRLIYLDVDLLVKTSLASLWRTDLQGKKIAAVEMDDQSSQTYDSYGLAAGVRFNAGVMLLDLQAMRQMQLAQAYDDAMTLIAPKTVADDQKILNHVFAGKVYILDYTWNHDTTVYRENARFTQYDAAQIAQAIKHPSIVHFTGRRKPWKLEKDRHLHSQDYWQYLAKTPWRQRGWVQYIKRVLFPNLKKTPGSTYHNQQSRQG
ncbi:MAG: glycosyltransferase family 8 protein [Phycisphaeraceae bacterium JB051]